MSITDQILETLTSAGPMCDDCLATRAKVQPRQTVNIYCRKMPSIRRAREQCPRCRSFKLVNFLKLASTPVAPKLSRALEPQDGEPRPWYWEGNVQARIIAHLASSGYSIMSAADTASHEAGKDIVAMTHSGNELWVSVKGYPERSKNVQARHWFSHAIFDLLLYRSENATVELAIGLPSGFATYVNLAQRIAWLRQTLSFDLIWVSEDGCVRIEHPNG